MIETHPYGSFVPPNARYLLLGSFAAKPEPGYDWFYSTRRNQFWSILEKIYGFSLTDKKSKQQLFTKLELAVADIISQCERQKNNNSDTNLVNIVYDVDGINKILHQNNIRKIYFSSRYVESQFKRIFKAITIELVTLPSPSPRYAAMSKSAKIAKYKKLLPRLFLCADNFKKKS